MKKDILFIILVYICFLIGCSQENLPFKYDNDTNIEELNVLDINNISNNLNIPSYKVATTSSVPTLEMIQEEYGIAEILRYNAGKYYSVTPLSDGKLLFVLFMVPNQELPSDNLIHITDSCIISCLADRMEFEQTIKIGSKMSEVISFDENAVFFENESYHRFNDRSYIGITYVYDEKLQQNVVSEIIELEKEESVINYLTLKDLAIIIK